MSGWRPRYLPISSSSDDEELTAPNPYGKRSQILRWLNRIVPLLVALLVGFAVARFLSHFDGSSSTLKGSVPQAPTSLQLKVFRFNESFAEPPKAEGETEPIWDSLIPNGLGYIRDTVLPSNLSVISVFHQLHCLYTIRRAYYAKASGGPQDFDFGLDRNDHAGHCFEYLRQGLMCSADSSIEPAENARQGFLGWGFKRQCRNYEKLVNWAEERRAFDGHGFLATDVHHGH